MVSSTLFGSINEEISRDSKGFNKALGSNITVSKLKAFEVKIFGKEIKRNGFFKNQVLKI